MAKRENLKPGSFYLVKPVFDVDFVPPGFEDQDCSDDFFEASWNNWWNKEQPALYLGDDKWVFLGTENLEWDVCWVGPEVTKPEGLGSD